jgi:hypothetical protein
MTISGQFLTNGKNNGGLFAPNGSDFALLGDLAVETATEDYFYSTGDDLYNQGSDDVPGAFMLEGLDPALSYELRLFGSRDTTETRETEYAVHGANEETLNLQSSGADIGGNGSYDGNDDEVTVLSGIRPDAFGQVFVVIAILNLLEYATGSSPLDSNLGSEVVAMETSDDEQFLTMTYQKNLVATDVAYQVEVAPDLDDWSDVPDTFVSSADGIEIRKASVPVTALSHRALRLKVTLTE